MQTRSAGDYEKIAAAQGIRSYDSYCEWEKRELYPLDKISGLYALSALGSQDALERLIEEVRRNRRSRQGIARRNAVHRVRNVHRSAEQSVTPLGGSVLVEQVVALAVLELADSSARLLAHYPYAVRLEYIRYHVLRVDKLVRGDNGGSRSCNYLSDSGKSLDLVGGTLDKLLVCPQRKLLRDLADDIVNDREVAVVDERT